MANTFTASAIFRAVDKVTAPMVKMGRATQNFAKRSEIAFARVEMQSRRLNKRFNKLLGTVGKLGLGFGALMIAQQIATANIELDASLASLSAITGKTGAQFELFADQVNKVAKEQKAFAGDTAKAFEVVASAQPILLDNADALGKVTNAAITLSKASGDDLAQSALSLTGVMNQFNLAAEDSERVMNALAAGSVAGSANITNTAASMKNFGAVAAGANISVEESIALVQVMGAKSIFAEEAGTKLRGSILKLQKAGMGYASGVFNINDALTESQAKLSKLSTARKKDAFLLKTFGAENITTGQILLSNIDKFGALTDVIEKDTNRAFIQAAINTNTLQNRLKEIQAAFKNNITATGDQNKHLESLKKILVLVADNMDKIIGVAVMLIKVFLVYKAVVIGVMVAQNGLLAVMAVAKFARFIQVVMAIAKAKGIWTAAQWALNVALNANPIGLIIIAVVALRAAVIIITRNFDEWGAAALNMLGPLGTLLAFTEKFKRNRGVIKEAFSTEGIGGGLRKIGQVAADLLLQIAQQIFSLLAKIPGLGKNEKIQNRLAAISKARNDLGIQEGEKENIQTTKTTVAQESIKREERITKQSAELNITNNTGFDATLSNIQGAPIQLTPTN